MGGCHSAPKSNQTRKYQNKGSSGALLLDLWSN